MLDQVTPTDASSRASFSKNLLKISGWSEVHEFAILLF